MIFDVDSNTQSSVSTYTVTVLGGGWIGKPLAKALAQHGVNVIATSTSESGCVNLQKEGIQACQLALPLSSDDSLPSQVLASDCVVVCIPPGIRYGKSDYPEKIGQLVQKLKAKDSQIITLIMLSSTAVYNGLQGNVDESSVLDLTANKVAIMHSAEQQVLQSNVRNKIVLRLAGLIGYNRHPGRFFCDERTIANPDSVINFIHQDDVLGLIQSVIQTVRSQQDTKEMTQIINCVADCHPSRREFYQAAHRVLGRSEPNFSETKEPETKCVISHSLAKLGYNFTHSNLLEWLQNSND